MARWTIDTPTTLDFDGVVALKVRAISGSVAVLSTSERPRLDVSSVTGQPLLVSHEAGILTVAYPDLSWEGLMGWLRPDTHAANITIAVPKDCPAQVGAVSASSLVSGIGGKTAVRSLSGSITLDEVDGSIAADTVSGDVDARGLAGEVGFKSVSGDLTLADAVVRKLDAKSLSGRITADLAEACGALNISTVSGPVIVRLPADASTQVQVRSTAGRVLSDVPGLASPGRPRSNSLTGTLGSGSGRLSVTTMSGQVTLLERGDPGSPGAQAEGGAV
jgi:putative adhesin